MKLAWETERRELVKKMERMRKIRQKSADLFLEHLDDDYPADDTLSDSDLSFLSPRTTIPSLPAKDIFSTSLSEEEDGEDSKKPLRSRALLTRNRRDEHLFRKL